MSAYFQPYFESIWPLVHGHEDRISAWSDLFLHIDYKVQCDAAVQWNWLSPELVSNQLQRSDDPHHHRWLLSFLKRRPCIELRGVSKTWQSFVRKKTGVHLVKVYSQNELSTEAKDLLIKCLESRWNHLEVHWKTDEKMMGGVKCYMDDYCWDLSIKNQIDTLALAFGIRGIT